MATPIDFVEQQWEEWQANNPASSFIHIDEAAVSAERFRNTQFSKGIGDNGGGCLHAVGHICRIARPVAEK